MGQKLNDGFQIYSTHLKRPFSSMPTHWKKKITMLNIAVAFSSLTTRQPERAIWQRSIIGKSVVGIAGVCLRSDARVHQKNHH